MQYFLWHALHLITCITHNYMHSAASQTPLYACLAHWHHCFMQQTCSIHMRNFVLARPHGWWAEFCPILTQKSPSIKNLVETLQVFTTWSSRHSALSVCSKAGTRSMLIWCQRSSLTARSDWLTLLLPCPSWSLISKRLINCWVIPFLAISALFQMTGWRRLRLAGCTSSHPSLASHSHIGQGSHSPCRKHERAYYPGGMCDSAADKTDSSRLWHVNIWGMKWSQKEWNWMTKAAL